VSFALNGVALLSSTSRYDPKIVSDEPPAELTPEVSEALTAKLAEIRQSGKDIRASLFRANNGDITVTVTKPKTARHTFMEDEHLADRICAFLDYAAQG